MSEKFVLRRSYLDNCTIGKVYFGEEVMCYTIERPWLNNEPNVSCVPAGIYSLKPYDSPTFGAVYALFSKNLGVGLSADYHRSYCLIHPANFVHEVNGCIAPGMNLHPTTWGVANSRKAVEMLFELIKDFEIDTLEVY